jgi:hypothetical protein
MSVYLYTCMCAYVLYVNVTKESLLTCKFIVCIYVRVYVVHVYMYVCVLYVDIAMDGLLTCKLAFCMYVCIFVYVYVRVCPIC